MKIKNRKKSFLLVTLLFSLFLLIFFTNIQISYAQGENENLIIPRTYNLIEIAEKSESQKNITSLDFSIPNIRWNITDLEFNFSDIKLERELKTYEGNFTGDYKAVQKTGKYFCQSVQINLKEKTTIYGAYIFGYRWYSGTLEPIKFQIQGFDNTNHIPNGIKYINQELNISSNVDWYFQKFTSPIILQPNNYSIVLNGTNILNPNLIYKWAYQGISPMDPKLYTSRYDNSVWLDVIRGQPFLYKLLQKTNNTYNPEEIGMNVTFDGQIYEVINGANPYSGNVSISNRNYQPTGTNINIPIITNKTIELNFSVNYKIRIKDDFTSNGSVQIRENQDNLWTVTPAINRIYENYTVIFKFLENWNYPRVYKNSVLLTEAVHYYLNGCYLYIKNETIPDISVEWEFTFNSSFIPIELDIPDSDWEAGQLLEFSLYLPFRKGNYTFILYDTNNHERENAFIEDPNGNNIIFNHSISPYAVNGDWKAFIYWINQTDAGAKSQIFHISGGTGPISPIGVAGDDDSGNGKTEVTGLDPFVVFMTILIIGIVSVSSFTSYATLKKIKKTKDIRIKKLFDKITNILSLSHIIVIDKNSGLNIYQEFYGGRDVDTTLVSGFLDAIRSFGIELTSARTQSQTISLEYQDSKILMAEFKSFRLILIMSEKASEEFLKSITNLSYDIDNNFGEELKNFKGDVVKFREIRGLIEKNLNTAFIFPLTVVEPKEVEPKPSERAMILKAKKLMKENRLDYFFTSFLLSEQNMNPKDIEIILKLLEKKIFQPIEYTSKII